MLILGIDTSCDDTSASVVKDGTHILSNIVSSQTDLHKNYGGIVPELASRRHIENIIAVIERALDDAKITLSDIEVIAVCHGPGLIGSLLVGCCFVKSFAYALNKPVVTVNHLEGHIYSIFLTDNKPDFPFLSLIISGGHTSIYFVHDHGRYEELGRTRDDAVGEAYDKVSKMLGLGYPGGPIIDRLASLENKSSINLPIPLLPNTLDFSFSGLKTSVKNLIKQVGILKENMIRDISSSFQNVIIEVLTKKVKWAVRSTGIKRVVLSGGVAANSGLRKTMLEVSKEEGFEVFLPPIKLCTDNGAMIASAGYYRYKRGEKAELDFNPKAYLPI